MSGIKLEPEKLKEQARRMDALRERYDNLFTEVVSDMRGMNLNWSALLANNFAGKINSVQKSFQAVSSMLKAGSDAAVSSANTFQSVDSCLAKLNLGEDGSCIRVNPRIVHTGKAAGRVHGAGREGKKTNAWDALKKRVGKAVNKAAKDVKSGVKRVIKKAKEAKDAVVKSYNEKGTAYKLAQWGKTVLKGAKGVIKITGGLALAASGNPIGILSVISGCNDMYNVGGDIALMSGGKYEDVGKENLLKDTLAKQIGNVTKTVTGDRKLGENIGKGIYYGTDLITSAASFSKACSGIKSVAKASQILTPGTTARAGASALYQLAGDTSSMVVSARDLVTLGDENVENAGVGVLKSANKVNGYIKTLRTVF